MRQPELTKFYVEFVGSIQVRWGIEVEAESSSAAQREARLSIPESSNDWSLGDGTNPVIDVEVINCTPAPVVPHDRDLGRLELETKYTSDNGDGWGRHPTYTREDWMRDVQNEDTVAGYWDWVYNSLQNEDIGDEA